MDGLPKLPPLRKPQYCIKALQAVKGGTIVLTVTGLCVWGTRDLVVDKIGLPDEVAVACLVLIYTETAVAWICFFGLLIKDPGVVRRSPKTCSPVPSEVAERLADKRSLDDLGNVWDGSRSFCMRCLVWRMPNSAPFEEEGCNAETHEMCSKVHCGAGFSHHCRYCERCVLNFDHHCDMFGVCIAGQGCSGNVGVFHCLVSLAFIGPATFLTSLILCGLYNHLNDDVPWIAILFVLWACVAIFVFRRPLLELARCRGVRPPCGPRRQTPKAAAPTDNDRTERLPQDPAISIPAKSEEEETQAAGSPQMSIAEGPPPSPDVQHETTV